MKKAIMSLVNICAIDTKKTIIRLSFAVYIDQVMPLLYTCFMIKTCEWFTCKSQGLYSGGWQHV